MTAVEILTPPKVKLERTSCGWWKKRVTIDDNIT